MRDAFLLITLGLVGCGSTSGNVFEPARYPSVRIAASEAPITLLDARKHVIGTRTFDTPLVSSPDEEEAKEIALHPRTRDAMQARMQRVIGAGTARLVARVAVREGIAGWSASWTAETAYAKVVVRVEVFDAGSGRLLVGAGGTAWAKRSSADVADEESADLFDRAVLRAFEEAITQPDFVPLVNQALSGAPPPTVASALPGSS